MRDYGNYERAKEMARKLRWTAPAKAHVEHPKYGSVIVPHGSKLSAIENAAELWRCDLMEIISTAQVWAVEPDGGTKDVCTDCLFEEKMA